MTHGITFSDSMTFFAVVAGSAAIGIGIIAVLLYFAGKRGDDE